MTIEVENEVVTAYDSKENKVISYDMPRASTAIYSDSYGSIMIESNTTFSDYYGIEDMTAKEAWKLVIIGKFLTLVITNKMSGNKTA